MLGIPKKSEGLDNGGPSFQVPSPLPPLPSVSQEPLEFSSYALGSARAQALQGEVDKMPEKGALELIDYLGPDYNTVSSAEDFRGWCPEINL